MGLIKWDIMAFSHIKVTDKPLHMHSLIRVYHIRTLADAGELHSIKIPYGMGWWMVQSCWVNFQCRGVLLLWFIIGQGPTALAIGVGGGCLDISSLVYYFSSVSLSLEDGPV